MERDDEEGVRCEPDGDDEYYDEEDEGDQWAHVIRKLMLPPKHDEET